MSRSNTWRERAEAAERQVEKLREALKPFADEFYNTHMIIPSISDGAVKIGITVLVMDIHRAHTAYEETEKSKRVGLMQ